MSQAFESLLLESGSLAFEDILFRLGMGLCIGFVIFLSYRLSHAGAVYSRKFNVTLFTLTILTTIVMMVIGNNLALSLGMVGALSIVRFRTAIKDSRDTAYIFWTIIAGICAGSGDFAIAAVGSSAVFVLLLVLGAIKNDDRLLLITRSTRQSAAKIEAVVYRYLGRKANLRVKNTTEESAELIYEISAATLSKAEKNKMTIVDTIYELSGVDYVNLVTQNDDIGS